MTLRVEYCDSCSNLFDETHIAFDGKHYCTKCFDHLAAMGVFKEQEARAEARKGLRPVEINGHQEYWKGWFHCWGRKPTDYDDPGTYAIVEGEGGGISYVHPIKIKFLG